MKRSNAEKTGLLPIAYDLNTRRLTWLYIAALSMVALLTGLGQIAVQRALRQLEGDAGIINVAGRQRMLSQRLPRLVLQLEHQELGAHHAETRAELRQMLQQWETSQKALEQGSNELSIPPRNSLAVRNLFRENAVHFNAVRDSIHRMLEPKQGDSGHEFSFNELRSMLLESDAFLHGMDKIVSQYATEAKQRVERLQWTERGLLAATLAVLLAEGLLIFSPAVASLQRALEQRQAVTLQLVNAKEMAESANRAKTAFLTRLSHELRTPLHAILGMLGELRRTKLKSSQLKRLQLTNQAARTLHSLVNDLLDVAGMESGASPKIRNRPVQLAKLLRGAIDLMQPIASKKGLAIQFKIDPAIPAWMMLDPDRTRQVIYNLLQNAIRYTEIGSIECTCREDNSAGQTVVVIEISDTGCGIARENQSRIFENFVSLGDTETRQAFGRRLGLGLPITLALVKAMEGDLSIASEVGQGTKVTVRLPLRPCDASKKKPIDRKQEDVEGQIRGWALAIDDSRTNLILMCSYLSRLGYKTVSATNATQALQAYEKQPPEVIVIDKHLGDEDGLALIARFRESIHGNTPAIYLVTADIYCQPNVLDSTLGIASVLHKPLSFLEFKKALSPQSPESMPVDEFSELRTQLQKGLIDQLPTDLSNLKASFQVGELSRVSLLVHRIRGASANAGLVRIEERCLAVESLLSEFDHDACLEAIDRLSEAITQFASPPSSLSSQ